MCVVKLYLNKDLVNCPIKRLTVIAGCEHLQVVHFLSVCIYIILEYLIIDENLMDILQVIQRYLSYVEWKEEWGGQLFRTLSTCLDCLMMMV